MIEDEKRFEEESLGWLAWEEQAFLKDLLGDRDTDQTPIPVQKQGRLWSSKESHTYFVYSFVWYIRCK